MSLPASWHPFLTVGGAAVGALGYLAVALLLRGGGSGGDVLQAGLVLLGAGLAVAFSPLVTQALVRVPPPEAADASGVLTTVIQLSQAVGVAVFGSLFLTLAARPGGAPVVSGHAAFATLAWIAATLACGALAAVPLARALRAAAELSGSANRMRAGMLAFLTAPSPSSEKPPGFGCRLVGVVGRKRAGHLVRRPPGHVCITHAHDHRCLHNSRP